MKNSNLLNAVLAVFALFLPVLAWHVVLGAKPPFEQAVNDLEQKIERGVTTKSEVMEYLGIPDEVRPAKDFKELLGYGLEVAGSLEKPFDSVMVYDYDMADYWLPLYKSPRYLTYLVCLSKEDTVTAMALRL